MKTEEFEAVIEEALRELPDQFAEMLDNVAVMWEEEPGEDDLETMDGDGELLGIFRGIPMTEKSWMDLGGPAEVVIFRGPLMRVCETREELREEIRDTVIHELGHYFGLDDHGMEY